MKKIAIIGAGWYGCHIASTLGLLGFYITIFEKESDIFTKASGNNQFRLHLGFHYARNYDTRIQSRDGYQRFMERYPNLSSEAKHGNIYAVPKTDSLIDFKTYKLIMTSSGIEFNDIDNPEWSKGIAGSIDCKERVIETKVARKYFYDKLSGDLNLGTPVESVQDLGSHVLVNGERFDFVVDCTWGSMTKNRPDVFYEPTILLNYRTTENFPAFTLVDGQLASIYPTENVGMYTLSSVIHTPIKIFDTAASAQNWMYNDLTSGLIVDKIKSMEDHISKYVPEFRDMFTYESPQLSMKTKIIGATDDRSCHVDMTGRCIQIMSGKIDTIFHAMERVLYYLESHE